MAAAAKTSEPKEVKELTKPTRFEGEVPIGMIVYWYRKGVLDSQPFPAVVVESDAVGVLDLCVLPRTSGECAKVASCYHKTHPGLTDEFGHPSAVRALSGCWDFTPVSRMQYEALQG